MAVCTFASDGIMEWRLSVINRDTTHTFCLTDRFDKPEKLYESEQLNRQDRASGDAGLLVYDTQFFPGWLGLPWKFDLKLEHVGFVVDEVLRRFLRVLFFLPIFIPSISPYSLIILPWH
jgi:hypothetical protein